jgi:hypothetical protein
MKWSEFKAAAPQIGELAQEAFDEQHLAILGTLRADGWPRISPCEVYFVEGEMILGMMPHSRKVEDLRRDGRITVVNGQENREPKLGDVKIYGRAREVHEQRLRDGLGDAQEALINWRPPANVPVFVVDVERASYISFGGGRRFIRWHAGTDEEDVPHPEQALEETGEGGASAG